MRVLTLFLISCILCNLCLTDEFESIIIAPNRIPIPPNNASISVNVTYGFTANASFAGYKVNSTLIIKETFETFSFVAIV